MLESSYSRAPRRAFALAALVAALLSQLLSPLAADATPAEPSGKERRTLEGILRLLAADTVEGQSDDRIFRGHSRDHYRLVLVVGRETYFVKGRQAAPNRRARVTGTVSGNSIDAESVEDLGGAPGAISSTATTNVLVMLAHWNVPDNVTRESARSQMFQDSNGWFRDASYTMLGQTGDVTPWMQIAGPEGGRCYQDHLNTMSQAKDAAVARGYNLSNYTNFVLYSPYNSWQAGSDCNGYAGWAYVGAPNTWLNGFMDRRITVHEQGHNYGLWHAHSYLCTEGASGSCSWSDYGDEFDAMGSSSSVGHFSASQKTILGWMSGRSVDLSAGGSATLAPLATDALAVSAAVVRISSSRAYWVEYRQPVDYDSALPNYGTSGLQIRLVDPSIHNDTGANLLDVRPSDGISVTSATLRPGESWTSPEGYGFTTGSASPSAATVSVTLDTTTPPTVTARAPGADATGVDLTGNVTATFSEEVAGVDTTTFTLKNSATGAAVGASVARNGATNQWILNPDVDLAASTRYTATLTGGASAIRDRNGNPLATTSWSFTTGTCPDALTEPDNTAAQARAFTVGATYSYAFCAAYDRDWVSFRASPENDYRLETLNLAPGTDTVLTLYGGDGTTVLMSNDDSGGTRASLITFQPNTAGTYYLEARQFEGERYGTTLTYDLRVSATADTTPPTVTARTPSADATAVNPMDNLTATFSEEVAGVGTTTFTLKNSATGAAVGASVARNGTTNQWILNPDIDLAASTRYTATLTGGASAIRDRNGNPLATTSWSFTTGTCPDALTEPDNTAAQARAFTVGATNSYAFCAANDRDWVSFGASTDNLYRLETLNLAPGTDTVLTLYGGDGTTVLMSNDDSGGTFASLITFQPTTAGTYYLEARQYNGNSGTTLTYDLRVSVTDTTPPTVTARAPSADATGVIPMDNVTATFSEEVAGVGTTTFTLKNSATGAAVGASVARNGTTNQWILNPDVDLGPDTRYTATLTGGSGAIRDIAGNALAGTSWTFLTGPAPTATFVPKALATGVSQSANVTATFSEEVNGVSATTFTLKNTTTGAGVSGVVSRNGTTNQWILNPDVNLAPDTYYTATLKGGPGAVRDIAGNPFRTRSWKFLTGPAPTVIARSPSADATGVSRTGNVTVTFSEAVTGVSGSTFKLKNAATGALVDGVVSQTTTTNQWSFNPSVDLAPGTRYVATLTGGTTRIRDVVGNPLSTTSWSFTTGS